MMDIATWLGLALLAAAILIGTPAQAADDAQAPCTEDAMLVFDASGSMSGNGWGYGSENPSAISRIDKVRAALAKVLPRVTRMRRVGLITYGPGPWQQCNVQLDLKPAPDAAKRILDVVNGLTPAGQTPLSKSVLQAADVLDYVAKPGVIVLLTDGEETCGGNPLRCRQATQARGLAAHRACHWLARERHHLDGRTIGRRDQMPCGGDRRALLNSGDGTGAGRGTGKDAGLPDDD
ncbi:MAG: VWA domain-containing protein [Methyloceanibacter sp.]|jgi:Ca-activated chloride channel family protein